MSGATRSVQESPRQASGLLKEDAFLLARRSLQIWPLSTPTVGSLYTFASKYLSMAEDEFKTFTIANISLITQSKTTNECLVEFGNRTERDLFRSFAHCLHQFRREAGIRLSLPDHLISVFKILENEGFKIVRRRPGTKRSIKFDDLTRSLVMDIKLPQSSWVRITPEQVVRASRGRKTDRLPAVSEILSIADSPEPEYRNDHNPDDYDEDMGDVEDQQQA